MVNRTKDQRPVCSKCQTPMVRYNVPHTDDREQAWRLACSCKHSAVSEVVPSNRITLAEWREKELTYVIGALATALELEDDEQRDALCDIREWAKNRLKAQLPDETQSAAPKQRLRTLRKTVEHFARSFQQDGHASSETVKELFEAAAVLESLEKRPDETSRDAHAALRALLAAPMVAEIGPDMKEPEDIAAETLARQVLRGAVEPTPSLLRPASTQAPPGCHCQERCMAPVVMGRQTPCRDPEKAARFADLAIAKSLEGKLCSDCPPVEFPDAPTRCLPCPRRAVKASECRGCKEGWHRQGSWHWDSIGHMHECTSQNGDEKHG